MGELWRLSVGELARELAAGFLRSRDVVDSCLDRVEAADGAIGAFTHLAAEDARSAAPRRTVSVGPPSLDGIPFGVKEIFEVAGWPHTAGSLAWEGRVGEVDSEAVRRLRSAGAIPIGLTRTHEFAMGVTTQHERRGSTRNPWNLDRVPGGSSGGSAAAVAAGMTPFALGTDTSGSVRIPAALCGVVGFRPTHGLVPTDGVVPLAPSSDTVGVLAREVEDVALILQVLTDGSVVPEARIGLHGLRVGMPRDFDPPVGSDQAEAVRIAVAACAELGATVVPVSLPPYAEVNRAIEAQRAEMIETHSRVLGTWPSRAPQLGELLRSRLGPLVEKGADAASGAEATAGLRAAVARLETDLVISPVTALPPSRVADPEGGGFRDSSLRCNHLQSVVAAPALAVPVGLDEEGLPLGVQLWGRSGRDALVLAAGALLRTSLRNRLPAWPPEPGQ